ncbi:MAG: ABC transporter permease [Nitrospinota bacterium]
MNAPSLRPSLLPGVLPDLSRGVWRVWQRNLDSFRGYYLAAVVANLGEHLIYLLGMGIGVGAYIRLGGNVSYLQFIAPGLVASSAMWSSSMECTYGSFSRMQVQKTYDAVLATPCSVADVVLGDILWGGFRAIMSAFTMLAVMAVFGLVGSPWVLGVFPLAFLEGLVFAALGMISTSLSPSYFFFNYHFTIVVTPMIFLSGIFFPLDRLGDGFRWVAWLLPLTHAVEGARALNLGRFGGAVVGHAAWLAVAAALLIPVAVGMIRRRIVK